ncbi:MAG: helix-turn-helix domain-containing protein [Mariprofundaceae bacterium]|nr:helix-turn-helix domain-containing protein [Mariprofundaceae bacterium]
MSKCPVNVQEASSREELLQELSGCLKRAREAQELSIEEIALSLKLRVVYLHALESGSWDEMPGQVYAIGFLKQYADYLNVDVSESVELLKTGQYVLTKPLTFPDAPLAPNKTWVIVAALAFIVLFILFNLFDDSNPDRVSPLPGKSEIPSSGPPLTQESAIPAPAETGASITEKPAAESGPSAEAAGPKPSAEAAEDEPSDTTATHHYRLTAVGADVWLQLFSPDEPPLLLHEALLRPGESMKIDHASPFLLLTCGNPTALQIEIDDRLIFAAGSLGEADRVLRNFRLTSGNQ